MPDLTDLEFMYAALVADSRYASTTKYSRDGASIIIGWGEEGYIRVLADGSVKNELTGASHSAGRKRVADVQKVLQDAFDAE